MKVKDALKPNDAYYVPGEKNNFDLNGGRGSMIISECKRNLTKTTFQWI